MADGQKPAVTEAAFTAARDNGSKIEVALQWTESTEETYRSYVNGIRTPNGGTHENGLKGALRKAINNYIETHDIKMKGLKITAEDIREGVVARAVGVRPRAAVPGADQGAAQQPGDGRDGR